MAGDETEVVDLDVVSMSERSGDGDPRRRLVNGCHGVGARLDLSRHGDAVELAQEVEMEPLASKLTVGDASDAGRLELHDHLGDRGVLDAAQLGVVDFPARSASPCDMDRGRAQEAADMIGPERRCDLRHPSSLALEWRPAGPAPSLLTILLTKNTFGDRARPHEETSWRSTNRISTCPGTTVFDAEQSRRGYWLNQFCMSLMKAENRERFKRDERPTSTSGR